MKIEIDSAVYRKCLADISGIYEYARNTLVQAYWHIGKYIYEVEQKQGRAEYGRHIVERLSKDLTQKYGSGFSFSSMNKMRRFYLAYSILSPVTKLEWSKYVVLLSVKDEDKRREIEKRALKEKLTRSQISSIVNDYKRSLKGIGKGRVDDLSLIRGELYTYSLVGKRKINYPKGEVVVDCGFNVWRSVPVDMTGEFYDSAIVRSIKRKGEYYLEDYGNDNKDMLYTYRASIERVIDGDTLWAVIDCGFDTMVRQNLRLRGIDAPEAETKDGMRAKRYLERIFRSNPDIVIRTHKSDKYDRYLSDIFYLPDERVYCSPNFWTSHAAKFSLNSAGVR